MAAANKSNSHLLIAGIAALVGGYFLLGNKGASAPAFPLTMTMPGSSDDGDELPDASERPASAQDDGDVIQNSITAEDREDAIKDERIDTNSSNEQEDEHPAPADENDESTETVHQSLPLPNVRKTPTVLQTRAKLPFRPLKAGQKDVRVRQLQQKLNIPATGIMDSLTTATLKTRFSIPQINTAEQLKRIMNSKPKVPARPNTANAFLLHKGSNGMEVRRLQQKLRIPVTGIFDQITEATLQARYKITHITSAAQFNNIMAGKPVPVKRKTAAISVQKAKHKSNHPVSRKSPTKSRPHGSAKSTIHHAAPKAGKRNIVKTRLNRK